MKYTLSFALIAPLVLVMLFVPLAFAQAYVVSTPYYCGSYWSSTPCHGSNYNYNYGHNYPYNYNYNWNYGYNYNYPHYNYQYSKPRPTCSISVSNSWNQYGNHYGHNQAATLSWSSSNATSAYISSIGTVSTYGSRTVYPYGNTTYTMTVYGPGGSNTCQTTHYGSMLYYPNYYQQYPYNYSYNYNYGHNYNYPYYYW